MKRAAPALLPSFRKPPTRPAAEAADAATAAATAAKRSAASAAAAAAKRSYAPQADYNEELFRVKGFRSVKVTKGAVPLLIASKPHPTADSDPPPPYDVVMASDRSGFSPPTAASSTSSASSICSSRTTSSWNNGGVLRPRDYKAAPANGGKKKQVSFRLARVRSSDRVKPKGTPAQRSSRPKSSSSSSSSRPKPIRYANGVTHSSNARSHGPVMGFGNGPGNESREEISPTPTRSSSPKEPSPPSLPLSSSDENPLGVSEDVAERLLGNFSRRQDPPETGEGFQPVFVEDRDQPSAPSPPVALSRSEKTNPPMEFDATKQLPRARSRPRTNGHLKVGIDRTSTLEQSPTRQAKRQPDVVGRRHEKLPTNGTGLRPARWEKNPKVLVVGGNGWASLGEGCRSSSSKSD